MGVCHLGFRISRCCLRRYTQNELAPESRLIEPKKMERSLRGKSVQPGTSMKHGDNLDACQQQQKHPQGDAGSANNHFGGGFARRIVVWEEFHSLARCDSPDAIGRLRPSWLQIMAELANSPIQTNGASVYSPAEPQFTAFCRRTRHPDCISTGPSPAEAGPG